jgi:hypothetical protein
MRNLFALGRGQGFRASTPTFQASLAAKRDGGRVFIWIYGDCGRLILDLAGEDIAYQLTELDGVAGSGNALCCHARIMARKTVG